MQMEREEDILLLCGAAHFLYTQPIWLNGLEVGVQLRKAEPQLPAQRRALLHAVTSNKLGMPSFAMFYHHFFHNYDTLHRL